VQQFFLVGQLMHKILCQPINRENDREALKTILNCVRLLKEDKVSIGVFPEGYTSLDGLLHPFRSGVFKIAQKAGVPIVVCTLQNTQYVLKNALKLKPTTVELHLVGVIGAEELKGRTAVDVGEQVHKMMADDLGPDKVLQA
jgi:1-acyl-sn-glycerol-3-phosphate acyltransferase